ncbi:MAG: DUF799 family lipoprotein [Bacteroidaceae bacterium]|nr:DUF799 family lipoprotein [Bacteroidaceae bacterium]
METKRNICIILASLFLLTSCSVSNVTRGTQYEKLYEEQPVTMLVMPPINNTSYVEAKEFLYTSISRPLAEAGYYVISPLLAMDILKAESAYDAELFVDAPLTKFRDFFGADAVVFSEINDWTKKGFGIQTNIRYFIRSTKTGEILFDRSCKLYLDLSVNSGTNSVLGALLDLAASTINTAATDHIVAARKANDFIFKDIPRGKYHPQFMTDKDVVAELKDISKNVK